MRYNIIILIVLALFLSLAAAALADDYGLRQTAGQAYTGSPGSDEQQIADAGAITDFPAAIGRVVGAVLAFVGVIFMVLMIYGGFTWMMARGNEQEVSKAKSLIEAAVVGLIIVLMAYSLTEFLGRQLL